MAFELSDLIARFEHIPTEAHQYEEKHQAVVALLLETAGSLLDTIPYGQEAEDVISALVKAGESAHTAIDKIAETSPQGAVKVGGQVINPPDTSGEGSGAAESPEASPPAASEAPAPSVDAPVEAPVVAPTDGAV